jgi:hypothetical protein
LLPAVQAAREAARRATCVNNLKQIGLALQHYAEQNVVFPPGTIATSTGSPMTYCDPWSDAANTTGAGLHGTGWLLRLLPFMEMGNLYNQWNFTTNVLANGKGGGLSAFSPASFNIGTLYCTTRRTTVRTGTDDALLMAYTTKGGGTDYGGCAGRVAAFNPSSTGTHDFLPAASTPSSLFIPTPFTTATDTGPKRVGIFFQPNVGTNPAAIRDGLSNTIITGELQRITDPASPSGTPAIPATSHDGWAVGGDASLFTTGVSNNPAPNLGVTPPTGNLLNNLDFRSPGSDHPGIAHFGFADGSVRNFSNSIDPTVFALLGSMADTMPVQIPD